MTGLRSQRSMKSANPLFAVSYGSFQGRPLHSEPATGILLFAAALQPVQQVLNLGLRTQELRVVFRINKKRKI
jgi:hypothetical protein